MMLELALEMAREAGEIVRRIGETPFTVREKGKHDLLTEADLAAQRSIVEAIRAHFPDHGIVAEEDGLDVTDGIEAEWVWIIDPIDGTSNFARGLPNYAVSIGLYRYGQPYLGVVYDPCREHLFYARAGQGAWLNGRPLRVSQRRSLSEAIVGYDWARTRSGRRQLVDMIAACADEALAIRSVGAAALSLCYVAAGWYDVYFNVDLRLWDIAAASLIVTEAGGWAGTLEGGPVDFCARTSLASNGWLHETIQRLYATIRAQSPV